MPIREFVRTVSWCASGLLDLGSVMEAVGALDAHGLFICSHEPWAQMLPTAFFVRRFRTHLGKECAQMKAKLNALKRWFARLSAGLRRTVSRSGPAEATSYNPRQGQAI